MIIKYITKRIVNLKTVPMFGNTYDGSMIPSQNLDSDDDSIYIRNNRIYDNETRSLVMANNMSSDGHDPSVPIKRTVQEKVDSGTVRSGNHPDMYARRGNACSCSFSKQMSDGSGTKSGFSTTTAPTGSISSFLDMTLSIREIFEFIILIMVVVLMAMYFKRSSVPTFVVLGNSANSVATEGALSTTKTQ